MKRAIEKVHLNQRVKFVKRGLVGWETKDYSYHLRLGETYTIKCISKAHNAIILNEDKYGYYIHIAHFAPVKAKYNWKDKFNS